MLNSTEYEIFNAQRYENIKKFSFFSGSDKPIMLLFMLINVKMPTIVGLIKNILANYDQTVPKELSDLILQCYLPMFMPIYKTPVKLND